MKKIFMALAAVAALVGCSKENTPMDVVANDNFAINASIVLDDTRVTVEGEHFTDVKWVAGDEVTLSSKAGASAKLVAESGGDTETKEVVADMCVTDRKPTAKELEDMNFGWRIVKHVKSNAIVAVKDGHTEGDGALIYYYDSYNEPCDIVLKDATMLTSVRLNLTTYTYASITDEDINSYARTFADGDYLKVVFTAMSADEALDSVEYYVVDYRDGKRFVATNWDIYDLRSLGKGYDAVRVTIETTDVGEYGANTPLYIALDELNFL